MSNLVAMKKSDNHRKITLIEVETSEIQKEADRIRQNLLSLTIVEDKLLFAELLARLVVFMPETIEAGKL